MTRPQLTKLAAESALVSMVGSRSLGLVVYVLPKLFDGLHLVLKLITMKPKMDSLVKLTLLPASFSLHLRRS
jgi:hypothetical protein